MKRIMKLFFKNFVESLLSVIHWVFRIIGCIHLYISISALKLKIMILKEDDTEEKKMIQILKELTN